MGLDIDFDTFKKEEYLKSKGWFQWYNKNYWCHQQFDSETRDCTNWGLSITEAYEYETDPKSKELIDKAMSFCYAIKSMVAKMSGSKKKVMNNES